MELDQALIDLIKTENKIFDLRLDLVCALVSVESSGKASAIRYEKAYTYYFKPQTFSMKFHTTDETEKALQRFSYGLLQIMGGTARYLGYSGSLLELLDPRLGLHWGMTYLKSICDEYLDLTDQISVYNAGSVRKENGLYVNQSYVNQVLSLLSSNILQ